MYDQLITLAERFLLEEICLERKILPYNHF